MSVSARRVAIVAGLMAGVYRFALFSVRRVSSSPDVFGSGPGAELSAPPADETQ